MIDPLDKNTIPLLPNPPLKRGRKSTGAAKTPAQRKREQRARDGWSAVNAAASKDYSGITTTGLLEQIAHAVANGAHERVSAIAKELVKRSRANAKNIEKLIETKAAKKIKVN